MTPRISDHALIGDTHTAALVALDGSITWLCLPRFDSPACFASLLGGEDNGHWSITPTEEYVVSRRYRRGTLVLETEFRTATGAVRLIDFMPHRHATPTVVRFVEGIDGEVPLHLSLCIRFDYGRSVPWVRERDGGLEAVAGPHTITVRSPVAMAGDNHRRTAELVVAAGERIPFVLSWTERGRPVPEPEPADALLAETIDEWRGWSDRLPADGPWAEIVARSLITLKALTYEPSGALVAAPTTSLPERLGGARNWDYRFTWLRDASFTLDAFTANGCLAEAVAWRDWLLRAVAGDPAQLQIVYGLDGERWLPELTIPWLAGYRRSTPVRIGNGAADQFQLDVYGEVLAAMHSAREAGMAPDDDAWALQQSLVEYVAQHWREPDEGIWEVRGGRRHFVHSKVMAWVAFDRAARAVTDHGLPGDAVRYRALADEVHDEVCRLGYDGDRGTFVQAARRSTPASCSCPQSASSRPPTPMSSARWTPSPRTCRAAGWSSATWSPTTRSHPTASWARKAASSCAASGSSTRSPCGATATARWRSSSGSSPPPTTSASSLRSTTRSRERCSATSRRPSLMPAS